MAGLDPATHCVRVRGYSRVTIARRRAPDGWPPRGRPLRIELPAFAERPDFHVERPGGLVLVRRVENLLGDGRRLDEKIVWPILEPLARPRHVDHCVDDDIG